MSQTPQPTNVVTVKPQSDIYTFLVILAILAVMAAGGLSLYNLLSPEYYGFTPYVDKKGQPITNIKGKAIHPDGTEAQMVDGKLEDTGYGLRFSDLFSSVDQLVADHRLPPAAALGTDPDVKDGSGQR